MHRAETTGRHGGEDAVYKSSREASGETNPTYTLISDLQPPNL